MGMTGGLVRASSALTVRGTFAPQGVELTSGRDLKYQDNANAEETTLQFGTGDSTFDKVTFSPRAIPAGSSVTYDLYAGTDLKGLQGETCAFRIIRKVRISIVSGGASGVRIGGAASNEWVGWFAAAGDKADIFAGGPAFSQGDPVSGKAVTNTAKNLKIENLSTTVECVIWVLVAGSTFTGGMAMGPVGLTYP